MIERWKWEGITLHTQDHGVLDLDELEGFLETARREFPGQKVIAHNFGLRVWKKTGDHEDPRLEWRDW